MMSLLVLKKKILPRLISHTGPSISVYISGCSIVVDTLQLFDMETTLITMHLLGIVPDSMCVCVCDANPNPQPYVHRLKQIDLSEEKFFFFNEKNEGVSRPSTLYYPIAVFLDHYNVQKVHISSVIHLY